MQIKNTLFKILLFLSVAAVLITGALYTQTNINKQKLNERISVLKNEYKKLKYSKNIDKEKTTKENAKEIYRGNNTERLRKQVEKLKLRYKVKSTNLDDIQKIIERYIQGRYVFNGGQKGNKDNIINKVKPYITDEMASKLSERLLQSPTGNMGASDNFKHTVDISDIFYTDIEQPDTNNNDSGQELDSLPYYLTAFVR